jgi:hypothetical protein
MLKLPVITQQIKHFKKLFDVRTYQTFQAVVKAIISLQTFKQADLAAFSQKTLRQIQYFFSGAKWCAVELNEFRLRFLRNKPDFRDRQSDFVVADSTVVKKDKDSAFNGLTDFFWSNLHKQKVRGFEIFGVSVQSNQGIKYVLDFMFFFKKYWLSETQAWKHLLKKISSKTRAWIFVFDSGFRRKYLLKHVYEKLKRHFLIRMLPDQHIFSKGWKKSKSVKKALQKKQSFRVTNGKFWVFQKARVKAWDQVLNLELTVIVYWRDGFRHPLVLAVSQTNITLEEALAFVQLYFRRWGIEQLFKELKSYFEWEKFRITSLFGIKKYLMLMVLLHSLLTLKKQEFSSAPPLKLLAEFVLKKLRNIKELTVIGVKLFLETAQTLTSFRWFSDYLKAKKLRLCMKFL